MDSPQLAFPADSLPAPHVPVPATIADYVILRQLGEGNHGRYYLARPPARLDVPEEFVALKVFSDRVSELAYDRGVRELRAFAAVRSPYLVTVYDAVLEDTFAYAMQYFPLGSLATPGRPLSRRGVHRALEQAARAAHALHEAGMAHSDIKPANILLAEDGGRLSDLGLARFLAPGTTLTSMGRASSIEYLDPDMIGGARPSRRTEIWALGATIHRALTGTGLYGELPDAQPLLAIRKVLAGKPHIDPSLRAEEAEVVRLCLAPDDERLPTAEAVADRLAALHF